MMRRKTTVIAAVFALGLATALAAADNEIVTELVANSEPDDWAHPGPDYYIFDPNQPDDHAIYYSAADWMRDPDSGLYLDGLVDEVGSFGMNFGNYYGDYPEGFDRQVKQLQEYMLGPAYAAPICADTLISATLTISADRVIDMSMEGGTDLPAPEFMHINVFAGDGLLTTTDDAQLDFDRCDRTDPNSWDTTFHLVSERGFRITQDEIDFYGGLIELEIDVTENVRALMEGEEAFAGFSMAGSHDGELALLSLDPPGSDPPVILPKLTLIGEGFLIGDLDRDGDVDLSDLAQLLGNYGTMSGANPEDGDLDGDGDVDLSDLAELLGHYGETGGAGVCEAGRHAIKPPPPIVSGLKPERKSAPWPRELGDFNGDGLVDQADRAHFEHCFADEGHALAPDCAACDLDGDGDVDEIDRTVYRSLFEQ